MKLSKYHNERWVVLGLGITGQSLLQYCQIHGIETIAMDSSTNNFESLKQTFPTFKFITGGYDLEILSSASKVIVSPGIDRRQNIFKELSEKGIEITNDLDLFSRLNTLPLTVITGSNGKTTVTTMAGEMAAKERDVLVGGNIGKAILPFLENSSADIIVLECSSFQLELVNKLVANAACCLNISADHMDRYDEYSDYIKAKHNIYSGANYKIYNRDDLLTKPEESTQNKLISFGLSKPINSSEWGIGDYNNQVSIMRGEEVLINCAQLKMNQGHHLVNALAAAAIADASSIKWENIRQVLIEFDGITHRCEFVRKKGGVTWINDSKGTNPGATIAAIKTYRNFNKKNIILILGGDSKNCDLNVLFVPIEKHVKFVIIIGKDAEKIKQIMHDIPNKITKNLCSAVKLSNEIAHAGDIVLLSPACASFDMFNNFQHRGDVFKESVINL